MDQLKKLCDELGLKGKDAMEFIKQGRAKERQREKEEREAQLERERLEREAQTQRERGQREREEREAQAQREFELRKLELKLQIRSKDETSVSESTTSKIRTPILPAFVDEEDNMDDYLDRFEKFATTNRWIEGEWATHLLTGRALETYFRLSVDETVDYLKLKKRF